MYMKCCTQNPFVTDWRLGALWQDKFNSKKNYLGSTAKLYRINDTWSTQKIKEDFEGQQVFGSGLCIVQMHITMWIFLHFQLNTSTLHDFDLNQCLLIFEKNIPAIRRALVIFKKCFMDCLLNRGGGVNVLNYLNVVSKKTVFGQVFWRKFTFQTYVMQMSFCFGTHCNNKKCRLTC